MTGVATAGLLVPELGFTFLDEGRDTFDHVVGPRARAEVDRLALQLGLEGLAERALQERLGSSAGLPAPARQTVRVVTRLRL